MNVLKSIYLKHRQKFLIFFSVFIFLAGISHIYFLFEKNIISNDECLWIPVSDDEGNVRVKFSMVKQGGVTWNGGVRDGDFLIAINDLNVKSTFHAQSILNSFNKGETVEYKVERNGELFEAEIIIKKLLPFGQISIAVFGLIWFLIGFVVLMVKPHGEVQQLFYLIGAGIIFSITYIYYQMDYGDNIFRQRIEILYTLILINMTFLSFLPFFIFRFFTTFPKRFDFADRKKVRLFLRLAPFGLIFIITIILFLFVFKTPFESGTFFPIQFGMLMFFWVSLVVGFVFLIINYRRLKTKEEKKPYFLIVVSYIIAILSMFYTESIAPAITDSIFNSPEMFTPIVLVVLLPISFGYSIFRYQLMDVSIVIKNTIIYGTVTLLLAAFYFLIVYVLGQTISLAIGTEYQGVIAGVVFIVVALVFQSTKDRYQDLITRKFYPEQFAYQKVLMKFNSVLPSIVGMDKILDSLNDTLVESLKLKQFGLFLIDKEGKSFLLKRDIDIGEQLTSLPYKQELFNKTLNFKTSFNQLPVIEQYEFQAIFGGVNKQLETAEIYTIIPLVIQNRIIGLLAFGLKHSGAQFAGKDVELLCAVASQAAISIENARLYESEAEKITMQRDLEYARKIQEGLLPRCIPAINGLELCGLMNSAMQVGGDYYDIIPAGAEKIFVIVGDVSGKGLSAALFMSKLQTMIQLYCTPDKTPREILIEINKRMFENLNRTNFITLSIGLFDTTRKNLYFCRAGHIPLILMQKGIPEIITSKGIGIGLDRGKIFDAELEEIEINYEHGDFFIFLTDGITEAMNNKDELFGIDRISNILDNNKDVSGTAISDKLISSVETFRGTTPQNDDITLVVVKCTG